MGTHLYTFGRFFSQLQIYDKNKQKIDTFSSISFELYIRKEKWIAFLESTDHFLSKEIQIYIV